MIMEKGQSYSIAAFFSNREHDLQTEKGITDITKNKLKRNLSEESQREQVCRICSLNKRL